MLDLTWLIPALPLAGFLVLLALGRRLGEPLAGWLATAAVGGSFAASVVVFVGLRRRARALAGLHPGAVRVGARRRLLGRRRASWPTRSR